MLIAGTEVNMDKIIKQLELVVVFEFTKPDFDKATKIITIADSVGFFKKMVFHQQLNNRAMIPAVLLKSPSGSEMEFTRPMNIFSGFEYSNKDLKLRIIY